MGWTGCQHFGKNRKDFLIKEFSGEDENFIWSLTDVSMRGSVAYGIAMRMDKKTNITLCEGIVILTRKDRSDPDWIYFKEMGETVMPYYFDAPIKLIEKLNAISEPFNDNARQWREKCLERAKKAKVKVDYGSVLLFAKPLTFRVRSGSFTSNQFTLVKYGNRRNIFQADDGQMVRISDWKKRDFTVLGVSHVQ